MSGMTFLATAGAKRDSVRRSRGQIDTEPCTDFSHSRVFETGRRGDQINTAESARRVAVATKLTRISPIGPRPFGLEECLEPCDCLWAIYGQSASGSGARRFVLGKKNRDFVKKACA